MKQTKKILVSSILGISLLTAACNRDDDSGSTAGKGGDATLRITAKHHNVSKNIINCKMYIKYNTSETPASYDDSVNCNIIDQAPVGVFSGLKKGNYYLYSEGYDTSISQGVKGGMPYTISSEIDQSITLPVTEGD
jgi:hypothetical protein